MSNKTYQECKYYNFGGDFKKGYSSYPTAYGARCEKYKEFFIIKDNKLTPNCHDCLNKGNKMEIKKIDEIKIYGINTNVYEYNNVKYVLVREVCDWIGYNTRKTDRLIQNISENKLIKETIYYKGQNRKMWFVNAKGVTDILSSRGLESHHIVRILMLAKENFNQPSKNYINELEGIIELNEVIHDRLNDFMKMLNS